MKIYFERSGGFVGRSISTGVDTNELPPEEALKLLSILEDVDFFCLPASFGSDMASMSAGDQLVYKVTVEIAGTQHTVVTSDTTAPDDLQPLLGELTTLARRPGISEAPVGGRGQ